MNSRLIQESKLIRQFTIKELNELATKFSVLNQTSPVIQFQVEILEFLSQCYEDGGWFDPHHPNFYEYDQDDEGFYCVDKKNKNTRVAFVVKSDPARAKALKLLANIISQKNSIYFFPDKDGWLGNHKEKVKQLRLVTKRPAIVIFYQQNGSTIDPEKLLCFLDDESDRGEYTFYHRSFTFDSTIKLKNIIGEETHNQNKYFLQQQIYASVQPSEQTHMGKTHQLYRLLSWYNFARILSIGIYLASRVIFDFSPVTMQIFHAVFGFAGLVFALEIILDTAMLIQAAKNESKSNGEVGRRLPAYKRVWNAFKKDGRSARMINAVLWFGINLACFILTGGIGSPIALIETTIANLIGFGLDLVNSWVHLSHNVKRLEAIETKANKILNKPEEKKSPEDQWLASRVEKLPASKENAKSARNLGAFLVMISILAGFGTFAATAISLGLIAVGIPAFVCTLITAGFYLCNGAGLITRRCRARNTIPEPEDPIKLKPGSTANVGEILGINLRSAEKAANPPRPPGGGSSGPQQAIEMQNVASVAQQNDDNPPAALPALG